MFFLSSLLFSCKKNKEDIQFEIYSENLNLFINRFTYGIKIKDKCYNAFFIENRDSLNLKLNLVYATDFRKENLDTSIYKAILNLNIRNQKDFFYRQFLVKQYSNYDILSTHDVPHQDKQEVFYFLSDISFNYQMNRGISFFRLIVYDSPLKLSYYRNFLIQYKKNNAKWIVEEVRIFSVGKDDFHDMPFMIGINERNKW